MDQVSNDGPSRRHLLRAGVALAGVSLLGAARARAQPATSRPANAGSGPAPKPTEGGAEHGDEHDDEISPAEDLMREHGVLVRVLVIYDEALRRLDGAEHDFPADALKQSAELVRTFVEDYHEKLEEDHLFPRFKTAHTLVELVDTLKAQHDAGRRMTDVITRLATPAAIRDAGQRRELTHALQQFVRMYLPHEAREDTVLFPAFRKLVTGHEYDALGEDFEKKEHELFGAGGFESVVERVAGIEKQVGVYDLAQFTPRV